MRAVSCPSTTICFAIASSGATVPVLIKDEEGVWSDVALPEIDSVSGLACPTSQNCEVTGT
jgi:hypothetical protein